MEQTDLRTRRTPALAFADHMNRLVARQLCAKLPRMNENVGSRAPAFESLVTIKF